MRHSFHLPIVFVMLLLSATNLHAQQEERLNDYVRVLPIVASGEGLMTTLVFVNPSTTTSKTTLISTNEELVPSGTLELAPQETRTLILEDTGRLLSGAVRISSTDTLSVSAQIESIDGGSQEMVWQDTILAEPLTAGVMIPIFVGANGIDNTGVAILTNDAAQSRINLFDSRGEFLSVATISSDGDASGRDFQKAAFLDELFPVTFPTIPEGFVGSIVVFSRVSQAQAFAVAALYQQGRRYWSAPVTLLNEREGGYRLFVKDKEDPSVFPALAAQYGFKKIGLSSEEFVRIVATDEVARALERDPRVERVEPTAAQTVIF